MYVITGGGTGGHLAIAKALAIALKDKKQSMIYIGSMQGQDRAWFEQSDLFEAVYFLDTTGVVNARGVSLARAMWRQLKGIFSLRAIFAKHEIKGVISVGGFSAGPASMAAVLFGRRLFIHEQNAIKGRLNQILSPFARVIFGSFEDGGKNFIKTPYPVRKEFFLESRVRREIKTILFLGGSQGAVAINNFALSLAQDLILRGYKIIHQCGVKDLERMKQEYIQMGIFGKIDLFDFSPDIFGRISQADCCVCRAGASSVWELAASGIPCLYVPYPYAAGDHQYHNALYFEKKKLGLIAQQKDLTPEKLWEFFEFIGPNMAGISQGLQNTIQKNGAEMIVGRIMDSLQA
ncbi:UDP-N-acetylglucosamine--N-acetylmuramyl-(pentapeptide) pyrophosphoryl-undecaprenol N-acetylglucosamine transferase [Helicobacter mustelae]|uniref:UDP-N-acetylglucosamine--N-acetylmuramyl-(pentapeptide) pyrophosphoryl-undecaprenol N-acetylglucosamine transferase n=1 Tax=Helicobacter mustelae (strain ATCC 43772 / CCUG 25715 / CIP 103759 / LMG 18044 / NCTC 12198 / R85-136P) TaxID=679897 RepID=D3UGV6_HELM1|nr:UDP-N-acetylglucosamine--N-acetylmuramyl-(pentapeptide) pyrophosphoryl-undecaprenol N-acetylglucosamine transferase [Helicobacter mustelae]CBG39728.1 putative UDP-N-acetylglucosamine--N-acetylmuramyl-(pentapeptide) pyrophosphoryl-undecaprenol N-acetylglucosamine transferase [Helicobacter mustelae 12198]SQH71234.1 UDP-N-acetylglucosamine--N-acetylmuramyl-(pentapeptide) pyrophosphoryl-undecaprenol N-acetylglucosamine transferase [Helicobacter mustelae]STP12361.1 UDP-N-acetylglucosamine--N-acety